MNKQIEIRTYSREVRLDETTQARTLTGYAVVWNQPSQDLGDGITEIVRPNAFGDLTDKDIRCLFNHDDNYLMGRTTSGTLRLYQDDMGLRFEVDLPPTSQGEDVYQLVKRGDLDGVSFKAIVIAEEWSADGKVIELTQMELIEVSPVVFPAFLAPSVTARSLDRMKNRPMPRFKRLDRAWALIVLDEE